MEDIELSLCSHVTPISILPPCTYLLTKLCYGTSLRISVAYHNGGLFLLYVTCPDQQRDSMCSCHLGIWPEGLTSTSASTIISPASSTHYTVTEYILIEWMNTK